MSRIASVLKRVQNTLTRPWITSQEIQPCAETGLLEALEDRLLLSMNVGYSGGVLSIQADSGTAVGIDVTESGGALVLTRQGGLNFADSGTVGLTGALIAANTVTIYQATTNVTSIEILSQSGGADAADNINFSGAISTANNNYGWTVTFDDGGTDTLTVAAAADVQFAAGRNLSVSGVANTTISGAISLSADTGVGGIFGLASRNDASIGGGAASGLILDNTELNYITADQLVFQSGSGSDIRVGNVTSASTNQLTSLTLDAQGVGDVILLGGASINIDTDFNMSGGGSLLVVGGSATNITTGHNMAVSGFDATGLNISANITLAGGTASIDTAGAASVGGAGNISSTELNYITADTLTVQTDGNLSLLAIAAANVDQLGTLELVAANGGNLSVDAVVTSGVDMSLSSESGGVTINSAVTVTNGTDAKLTLDSGTAAGFGATVTADVLVVTNTVTSSTSVAVSSVETFLFNVEALGTFSKLDGGSSGNSLTLTGSALNADMIGAYTPSDGDSFEIITGFNGGITGTFSNAADGAVVTLDGVDFRVSYDAVAGTVTLITGTAQIDSDTVPANDVYSTGEDLDFTVTWSENVVVTGTPRLQLTVGGSTVYADYASGSGSDTLTFTYTVQAGDTDSDGIAVANAIDLNGGTIKDSDGADADTTASFASTAGVQVDTTAPSVTGDTVAANGSYKAGDNLDFTVTWDEDVNVTGTPRLVLTLGGSTVYANYFSGDGGTTLTFRYAVQAGDTDSDGIAVANAIDLNGGSLKDDAGNNAAATASFASTAGVQVDTTAPSETSDTVAANGSYKAGDDLDFTVTWDEAITVTGMPRLALTIGAGTVYADYASGSGSDTLTFTYTIHAGDGDTDGIAVTNTIDLNGGTLADAAGNNAAIVASFASTTGVLVDTTLPTSDTLSPLDEAVDTALDAAPVITFDENILLASAAGVKLYRYVDGVSDVEVAVTLSVSGADLTITPDANLSVTETYYIEIAAGAVTDIAGNGFAGISGTDGWDFQTVTDVTPPTIGVDQETVITNDATPILSGTCSADTNLITVDVGGTTYRSDVVGEVVIDATTWTLALAGTPEGSYDVTVTATDIANNPAVETIALVIAQSDQPDTGGTGSDDDAIVNNVRHIVASYTDHDGDLVKISLRGEGTFDLLLTDDVSAGAVAGAQTLEAIVLSGVAPTSRLVISVVPDNSVGSDGVTEIGYISSLAVGDSDGSLKIIRGQMVNLIGGLELAGSVHKVVFADISGDISGQWFGRVVSHGDMTGNLIATGQRDSGISLSKLRVVGTMLDNDIITAGSIDRIRVGAMSGCDILAGIDSTVTRHAIAGADFVSQSSIRRVVVLGLSGGGNYFVDANISAAQIGAVKLTDIDFNNAGADFGIWGQSSIKRVSWRSLNGNGSGRWDGQTEGNIQDDFCIDLLAAL